MASALMAFVQGLNAENASDAPVAELSDKVQTTAGDASEVDEAEEDLFGESNDEKQSQSPAQKLQVSEKVVSPLVQVAQTLQLEQQESVPAASTLAALAAEMNQEEQQRDSAQKHKVQHAVAATGAQVVAERAAQRGEEVAAILQTSVAEQAPEYEDDEFEEDAASVRAAAQALATNAAKAQTKTLRQRPRGAQTKAKSATQPTSKQGLQRAMQDKLSAFQFQQLSVTQRRLFLATLAQSDGNAVGRSKQRKKVVNRAALDELAKDKVTLARQKQSSRAREFARLDDNRHCRFTPRLHGSSSKKTLAPNDSDDENDGSRGGRDGATRRAQDFVRRMEAAERARREQLRRTREEQDYLARVDKKECPSCGNPQSYSELTQKRKKCPNCGVAYRSRIAWTNVAEEFLARMEEFQQSRETWQREQQLESERREVEACGPESCAGSPDDARKTWEEVRDEFLGRVQLDLDHRELSRAAIWEEIQRECSFSPAITRRARRLEVGGFDDRLRRDLDQRRLRREQIEAQAEAAITKVSGPDRRALKSTRRPGVAKSARSGSSVPFQERVRIDLERRRARAQQV